MNTDNPNILADTATQAIDPTIVTSVPLVSPTVVDPTPEVAATPITLAPVADAPVIAIAADKPKRERKPRTPKVEKRGRGRPNVYTGALLTLIIQMVRACHNVSLVRAVLTSKGKGEYTQWRKSLATSCEQPAFDKPMTISLPMLGKYAADAEIEMPKGRPSFDEQAKQVARLKSFVDSKAKKAAAKAA